MREQLPPGKLLCEENSGYVNETLEVALANPSFFRRDVRELHRVIYEMRDSRRFYKMPRVLALFRSWRADGHSREFLARAFLLLGFLLMRLLFLVSSPIEEHRYSCLHTARQSAVFFWMMNEASDFVINRALRTLSARGPLTSPK